MNYFVSLPSMMAKLLRLDKKKKRVSLFCARLFVILSAKTYNNSSITQYEKDYFIHFGTVYVLRL